MLTEGGVEAKNCQKNAEILHRMGACAQKLTYFNPQQSGKSASEGSKKGVFRAKMAPQDEPFFSGNFEHFFEGRP